MKRIGITQRVELIPNRNERRDALDQRWHPFLRSCGLVAVPLPNDRNAALHLFSALKLEGVILSGGNDIARLGGDVPERDETEQALTEAALAGKLPVVGVCRGMQFLADMHGGTLAEISGHIATRHEVTFEDGGVREVNSYHRYGVSALSGGLNAQARAKDESIEAMTHANGLVHGIMWHPERETIQQATDIAYFQRIFR